MKKLLVIFAFLFAVYSCKGQELYIVIDTRDTVNMWSRVSSYKNPDYVKGEYDIDYFIKKDDIGMFYGEGVYVRYRPYNDSILSKSDLRRLRTKKISVLQWKKLKRKKSVKVVDGIEWVHSTPWDTIYVQMYQYHYKKGGMYIVDRKFTTQDSIQIRGVGYVDIRAQE